MRVDIYRNLHKKCWSIRSMSKGITYGKVISYVQEETLFDCSFIVGEKGRERVIKMRRKNVHAFVRGKRIMGQKPRLGLAFLGEVSYNPYIAGHFYLKHNGLAIKSAAMVKFFKDKVFAYD